MALKGKDKFLRLLGAFVATALFVPAFVFGVYALSSLSTGFWGTTLGLVLATMTVIPAFVYGAYKFFHFSGDLKNQTPPVSGARERSKEQGERPPASPASSPPSLAQHTPSVSQTTLSVSEQPQQALANPASAVANHEEQPPSAENPAFSSASYSTIKGMLRLHIKMIANTPTGYIDFDIDSSPDEDIENLKQKIQDKTGYSPDKLRLVIFGKQLEDGRSLKHYNIEDQSTVHVISRNRS